MITALGEAASAFRETLGESLASVQRYDANIEQATTHVARSAQGLQPGHDGAAHAGRLRVGAVLPPRRSSSIRSSRSRTRGSAPCSSNLGERAEAEKAATRAYELRDKVSERERLYIEARYYTTVVARSAKAIESYRLLLATYPDDFAGALEPRVALSRSRHDRRRRSRTSRRRCAWRPASRSAGSNLGYAYLDEDRFAEARREFEEVLKMQESTSARSGLFIIATLTGDQALADAQVAAVQGRRDESRADWRARAGGRASRAR